MPEQFSQSRELFSSVLNNLPDPNHYEIQLYKIRVSNTEFTARQLKTHKGFLLFIEKDTQYLSYFVNFRDLNPKIIFDDRRGFEGVSDEQVFKFLNYLTDRGDIQKVVSGDQIG